MNTPLAPSRILDSQRLTKGAETTINWVEVARRLPGRNNKDCRKRWTKISEQWRKGSWDDQENVRLRQAVEQVGTRYEHTRIRPEDKPAASNQQPADESAL